MFYDLVNCYYATMTNRSPVRYCDMTLTMACFLSNHSSLVRSYKERRMNKEKGGKRTIKDNNTKTFLCEISNYWKKE